MKVSNIKDLMAEEVGFEPTEACTSAVFKTAALNHSATLPLGITYNQICGVVKPFLRLKGIKFASE